MLSSLTGDLQLFIKRAFLTFAILTLPSLFLVEYNIFSQSHAKSGVSAVTALARAALPRGSVRDFGPAPATPRGALNPKIITALDTVFIEGISKGWTDKQTQALQVINNSKDPRLAWIATDLLRFAQGGQVSRELHQTLKQLLNLKGNNVDIWNDATNRLMAWDIPAPPNYIKYKSNIYSAVLPEWKRIFVKGDIDWRFVSWGGVLIDNRPFDKTDDACNCIPAADNPPVTDAKSAKWLDDNDVIFGIVLNGEARAYPRQIMEVREMVNDTLGGRNLGIPYCTLCGAAQAWFTDEIPNGVKRPVLRTSGFIGSLKQGHVRPEYLLSI